MASRSQKKYKGKYQYVYEDISDNWFINLALFLLLAGLITALIRLALINIAPYIWLVKNLGGETNQFWIDLLPIIGAIHRGWVGFVQILGGFLLWAMQQILQTLWIIAGLDRKAHRGALRQARDARTEAGMNSSTRYERRMSKRAQSIPFFFLKWSALLGMFSYALDGILGLVVFPPAEDFQQAMFAMFSGMFSQLDGGNILNILIMMFSFEALLVPTVVILQWWALRNED